MTSQADEQVSYTDLIPRPDPTKLTDAAIERATTQYRRELDAMRTLLSERIETALLKHDTDIASLRDLMASRMDSMDAATQNQFREVLAASAEHAIARDRAVGGLREVITQRLDGMDTAARLLGEQVAKIPAEAAAARGHVREEFAAADHALRELLGARIDGMDQATKLLAVTMDKVPSDIDRAIRSLREVLSGEIEQVKGVTLEKFTAVDGTFASNALALTAALAAQKEAASEQNKSNTLAISKSEQGTKETIAANANQTSTGLAGLSAVLDDLKARVVRMEALLQSQRASGEDALSVGTFRQTAEQNRVVQARATLQLTIAGLSALIAIVAVIFAVVKKLAVREVHQRKLTECLARRSVIDEGGGGLRVVPAEVALVPVDADPGEPLPVQPVPVHALECG